MNSLRFFGLLAVLYSVSMLAGCAGTLGLRPASLDDATLQDSGVVFATMSRIEGLPGYSSYYYDLRSVEDGSIHRMRVWVDGFSPSGKADVVDGLISRHLLASTLPPGRYEFFQFLAFATNGYVEQTETFTFRNPREFVVEAGKAYYLTAGAVVPRIGKNWLGFEVVERLLFVEFQDMQKDVSIAKSIYPNLPPVSAVEPLPEKQFDQDAIIELARTLNPGREI